VALTIPHPPPSSAEVTEIVQLHLYTPSGPSWPCTANCYGTRLFPRYYRRYNAGIYHKRKIYMFLNQLITETWERLLAIMGIHEAELHRRTTPTKVHSLYDLAEICLMCNLYALEPCQCQEMCAVKWMMYHFLVWPDRPKREARELTEIQPFAISRCFNTNV
jgi:hypothetical protein